MRNTKNVLLGSSIVLNLTLGSVVAYYWLGVRPAHSSSELTSVPPGPAATGRAQIEFRIAEDKAGDGLSPIRFDGEWPETLFVRPTVVIANDDIESVSALTDWYGPPKVRLTLTEEGRRKLDDAATANRMKRIAILIDGKGIVAPVMDGPVLERTVDIEGALSRADVQRIAAAFGRK